MSCAASKRRGTSDRSTLTRRPKPLRSDSAVLEEEPDPSGRPWLRIARVDGRSDDILTLPARGSGEVCVHPHRLRAPFGRIPAVRQYQVVYRPGGLLVRIVPASMRDATDRGCPGGDGRRTRAAGADVQVRVVPVAELEREPGPGAKLRLVRSEM